MKPSITIKQMNFGELKELQRKSPRLFEKAMEKAGIQFMNWANNGSAAESRKPPIKWGVLRGSASTFVANRLIGITKEGQGGTPATTYNGSPLTLTWAWNTDYAAKMHEHTGNWGPATKRDGDGGNKWLEKHLKADKQALIDMIAKEFWDGMGKSAIFEFGGR